MRVAIGDGFEESAGLLIGDIALIVDHAIREVNIDLRLAHRRNI